MDKAKDVVAKACIRMRITQAQLAEKLGVSPQVLNNWLNRRRAIPAKKLPLLAALCKEDPATFDPSATAQWRLALQFSDKPISAVLEQASPYFADVAEEDLDNLDTNAVTVAMAWSGLNDQHKGQVLAMINAYAALESGNQSLIDLANNADIDAQRAFNGQLEKTQVILQSKIELSKEGRR